MTASGFSLGDLIVSEGTVIGKSEAQFLPHKDYYTSAKIDSGMSGVRRSPKQKTGNLPTRYEHLGSRW